MQVIFWFVEWLVCLCVSFLIRWYKICTFYDNRSAVKEQVSFYAPALRGRGALKFALVRPSKNFLFCDKGGKVGSVFYGHISSLNSLYLTFLVIAKGINNLQYFFFSVHYIVEELTNTLTSSPVNNV